MTEPSAAEIRAWARANGHAVAGRGRIPAAAVAAYVAAHQAPAAGTSNRSGRRPVIRGDGTRREAVRRQSARPAPVPEASAEAPTGEGPEAPEEPTWQPPAPEAPSWQPPAPAVPTVSERPAWQPTAWGAPPSAPPPSSPPPQWGAPGPSPAWGPPPPPAPSGREGRDGLAITSLVLGIIPVGILGIVVGIIALVRIRRSGRRGRGMAIAGIVLGSLWFVGVASAVAIGVANTADRADDGAVVARGSVAATELRTGDCPSALPDSATRTLSVVPCTEPHVAEVFASFPISSGAYPGEAEAKRFGGGGCTERLAGYVGPGREDEFDLVFLYPTDQSWRLGDRAVSCMVTAPDGATIPRRSVKAG